MRSGGTEVNVLEGLRVIRHPNSYKALNMNGRSTLKRKKQKSCNRSS
uniref:Uncharacterized protein n=1 Tax=Anguilla anguilla TaxID=7936 RepID=A0A0E9V5M4_ANGAN